jgi:hypothetical protein
MDNMEEMMQQIMDMLVEVKASADAFQEKMAADRKAKQEDFLARMEAIFDDNRKEEEAKKRTFWQEWTPFTRRGWPC